MKNFFIIVTCLLSIFLVLLLAVVIFPDPLVSLYIKHIEKELGVDIDFSSSDFSISRENRFKDIKISSKTGYTVTIDNAVLYPPYFSLSEREIRINCRAQNLRFRREFPLLDAVCGFLSIPQVKNIVFSDIAVNTALKKNKMDMESLEAVSKDIKIYGGGMVDTETNLIDYQLKFILSEDMTQNIPNAIKMVLLDVESPSWMALNIKVSGDYRKPRLNVQSGLLNLNIKEAGIK